MRRGRDEPEFLARYLNGNGNHVFLGKKVHKKRRISA